MFWRNDSDIKIIPVPENIYLFNSLAETIEKVEKYAQS